jgi:hypothetical protein
MSTVFISPVGRLVQGGMSLQAKKEANGQLALDKTTGQSIHECFLAIAVRKDDPQLPAFYALFDSQARMSFPHLFPNGGACTHPQFAWKIQDGDGVDNEGKSVAGKPGFAGHYIFKMATRFAPRCFHHGKYDPSQQIQNPDDVIKKGYFVRVSGTIDGNGVQPGTAAKPGLYVSPNLVELVAFGEEIVSGPDAAAVFGGAPAITLPAGASTAPILPAPGMPATSLTPPPLPGQMPTAIPAAVGPAVPPVAAPALPLPGAASAAFPLPGAVSPAAANPQPQYQMTASAQGATREQLHALNWTDDALIAAGHMIRVA